MANDLTPPLQTTDTHLTQFLTYRLARVQTKLNMQATRILRENADITLTHWRILVQIGALGETTAAELSRLSAMDKGLISRNVKTMLQDGVITSTPDKRDTRVHHLRLTDKGQSINDKMLPIMRRRQAALQAHLKEDELAAFKAALDKLEHAAEDPNIP